MIFGQCSVYIDYQTGLLLFHDAYGFWDELTLEQNVQTYKLITGIQNQYSPKVTLQSFFQMWRNIFFCHTTTSSVELLTSRLVFRRRPLNTLLGSRTEYKYAISQPTQYDAGVTQILTYKLFQMIYKYLANSVWLECWVKTVSNFEFCDRILASALAGWFGLLIRTIFWEIRDRIINA